MFKSIATATLLFVTAHGACDNQCSGHGTCLVDDVCQCYDNWGVGLSLLSGDCSDRICPFDIAWVDTPDVDGDFHRYAECSGKGLCDRSSGLCECFDGYEGKACQRTSCPNDCSGHGTCEYIEDIAYGTVFNQYQSYDLGIYPKQLRYFDWDLQKTRGCVCDAQYTDVDCSKRMCPHGNDVLDLRPDHFLLSHEHNQVQYIRLVEDPNLFRDGWNDDKLPDRNAQTFAITFKSRVNETFSTIPIRFDIDDGDEASLSDFANDIRLALVSLPNQVIDDCDVSVRYDEPSRTTIIRVTFTGEGVQGVQNLLQVQAYECSDGCTPKISGLALHTVAKVDSEDYLRWSSVNETVPSEFNSYECGRRGKCDYTTGLCSCFEGYTGENCNEQTTLV